MKQVIERLKSGLYIDEAFELLEGRKPTNNQELRPVIALLVELGGVLNVRLGNYDTKYIYS